MGISYTVGSVTNMRGKPSHDSEIVSQALFGEIIIPQNTFDGWVQVETPDGYVGWVPSESVKEVYKPYIANAYVSQNSALVFSRNDIKIGPAQILPYGVGVNVIDDFDSIWAVIEIPGGNIGFTQKGNLSTSLQLLNKSELASFAKTFQNIPYFWGGRSSFGFDCSGFIQFLYSRIGIGLQRDSHQQSNDVRLSEVPIDDMQTGDLIFWGNSNREIRHVGMFIGSEEFIHSSSRENQPWVRVSKLSDPTWSARTDSIYPFRVFKRISI